MVKNYRRYVVSKVTATIAGGCFWCTEAVFMRLKGVLSATPGYAGGKKVNPTYEEVSEGSTGHAEAIQIEYDPSEISYGEILEIFWHTHNPTTLNRQGNDTGSQYRSVIFYHNPAQKQIAEKSKSTLEGQKLFTDPIVTEIIPFTNFYPAEDLHKNYFDRNPTAPYCNIVISPKIRILLNKYSKNVQDTYK